MNEQRTSLFRDTYLQAVLENIIDGVVTTDQQGIIESINPATETLFGYPAAELLGQNIAVLMPEPFRQAHDGYIRRYLDSGERRIIGIGREVQGRRRDGTLFPLELAVSEMMVEGRRLFVGTLRDISRRRAAENALRRERSLLNSLVDSIPDLIFYKDLDGCYLGGNRAFRAFVDLDPAGKLEGLTDYDLFDRELADHFRAMDREMINQSGPRQQDEWVTYPDGRRVLLNTLKTPYYGPDGELLGLIGVSRDITAQHRAEEALRLRDRAMTAARNGIVISDLRQPDQPIIYCNPAFTDISGYEIDEVVGRNCRFLQGPDTDQAAINVIRQAIRDGESCQVTLKNYRKDGTLFYNELTLAPVQDDQGRITHFVGIQSDITARVKSQKNLRSLNDNLEQLVEQRTRSLRQAEAKYRTIFENAVEGIFQTTPEGRYLAVNPALASTYGYDSPEQMLEAGLDIARQLYLDPNRRAEFQRLIERDGQVTDFLSQARRRDGTVIWLSENARLVQGVDGRPLYYEGTVEDVTERILAEQALRKSEQRFRLLIEQAADAFFLYDPQGRFVDVNQRACDSLGYSREELLAMSLADVEVHFDKTGFPAVLQRLKAGEALTLPGMHRRRDGSRFSVESRLGYFAAEDGERILALVRDLSEREEYEALLEHQANHDLLTGLPNRVLLLDRLGQALHHAHAHAQGQQIAVLTLGLDQFKKVNDSLGHRAGDALLQESGERLRGCLREVDTLARSGGDEFVVVMEGLERESQAAAQGRRLLEVLAAPFRIGDQEVHLSASIGVGLSPRDGEDAQGLLRNADAALHRAKDQGRGQMCFYAADMNGRALERLNLETQLRRALEREQFQLHYQPQVELDSGRVIGVEALLRWQHPELGMVSPGDFIPLAEETGLIVPIGDWVLQEACRQSRHWLDQGLTPVRMAVNLSAQQFQQRNLPAQVRGVLEATDLPPHLLELEITESLLMKDVAAAIDTLQQLKDMGINLAIDDFGTGYSSLSYLKQFPIDRLKIDRSFVRDVTRNPDDAAIALAIIAMAHSLRLGVIAEGVEVEEQLSFLRTRRCDEMQGFYFSRPLDAAATAQLLLTRRGLRTAEENRPRTVVIVDDDQTLLAVLRQYLAGEGYRVLTAHNGHEGLSLLAQHRVGVVIADEVMPGMSGNDFLTRVRELYPETVRIVISGNSTLHSLVGAINRSAVFRFLNKPVDRALLLETLQEAFTVHELRDQPFQEAKLVLPVR